MNKSVNISLDYSPTKRQKEAHFCEAKYVLYGGAMGGGKSVWLAVSAILHAIAFPGSRILMARHTLKDFKDTTLVSLFKFLPPDLIVRDGHNKQERVIKLINGSIIKYTGLADEDGVSTLKSFECSLVCIDEANEISKDIFEIAKTRLRWVTEVDGKKIRPNYKILLTSNPEDCWLKDTFIDGKGTNTAFIQALPSDNIYLPEDYEENFNDMPEEWKNRYWHGSWDDFAEGNFVIERHHINESIDRIVPLSQFATMGIDVARGVGGDETVIMTGLGGYMDEVFTSISDKVDQTAIKAQGLIHTRSVQATCIDDIGIGAGVTDMLQGYLGIEGIEGINVGKRSEDERFFNLRAELWWNARCMFRDGKVSIKNDQRLIRQLQSVKYVTRNTGKIMIEPKTETKKRLGESPDRADALILMLWAARNDHGQAIDFNRQDNLQQLLEQSEYGWDNYYLDNTNYQQYSYS